MIKEQTELLEIDFSKYKKVILDKVVVTINKNTKIKVNSDPWEGISIVGFINNEYTFSTHYDKDDKVSICELDGQCLVIRREGRKG